MKPGCPDKMKPVYRIILLAFFFGIISINSIAQHKQDLDSAVTVTDSVINAATDSVKNISEEHGSDTMTGHDQNGSDKNEASAAPVTLRTIPDSTMQRFKKDEDFGYANDPAYWLKKDDRNGKATKPNWFLNTLAALLQSRGFKYFIFLLLAAILGFALYKIMAENNWRIFERSTSKSKPGEGGMEEIREEDLEGNLQKALHEKDFRMSVRYLFLKSLHLLNDQGMIRLSMQATNQEYVDQMKGHPQSKSFQFLENAYDHVWYGGFILSEEQFEWLHRYFLDFYQSIESWIPPRRKN